MKLEKKDIVKKVWFIALILIILLGIVLFSIGSNPNPPPEDGDPTFNERVQEEQDGNDKISEDPPNDISRIINKILEIVRQGIKDNELITISSVKKVDWPNSCIGVQNEGEVCAQVITPGYKVVIKKGNSLQIYHTNFITEEIRFFKSEGF